MGLMALLLTAGGLAKGSSLNDPTLPFSEATQSVLPYLRGRTVAVVLLTTSHCIFAFHFGLMLLGLGRTASVPTFLNPVEESEAQEAQV